MQIGTASSCFDPYCSIELCHVAGVIMQGCICAKHQLYYKSQYRYVDHFVFCWSFSVFKAVSVAVTLLNGGSQCSNVPVLG